MDAADPQGSPPDMVGGSLSTPPPSDRWRQFVSSTSSREPARGNRGGLGLGLGCSRDS